jgi:hypothetical protein
VKRRQPPLRARLARRSAPFDKDSTSLWDDGKLAHLNERFDWMLQSPGIGLLTAPRA